MDIISRRIVTRFLDSVSVCLGYEYSLREESGPCYHHQSLESSNCTKTDVYLDCFARSPYKNWKSIDRRIPIRDASGTRKQPSALFRVARAAKRFFIIDRGMSGRTPEIKQSPAENNSLTEQQTKNTSETTETAEAIRSETVEQFNALDQREVIEVSGYQQDETPMPPQLGMTEDRFDAHNMMRQPIKVASATWTNGQTVATQVLNFSLPTIFETTDSFAKKLLAMYSFWKPIFKIKVVLNTLKFHQGKLLCIWDPMNVWFSTTLVDQFSATGLPFGEIDAGSSNEVEMSIPFEYFTNYFSTIDQNPRHRENLDLGTFRILVLNPLQEAGATSSSIPVNVWLWAEDVELHVPITAHIKNSPAAQERLLYLREKEKAFEKYWQSIQSKEINSIEQEGIMDMVSKGAGLASKVSKGANTVSGAFADLKSGNIRGVANKALDFFGLDRPADIQAHSCNHLATTAPLNYMNAMDNSVRLGSDPLSDYTYTKFSVSSAEETNISKIIQKPQMFAQGTWTTSTEPDEVLLDIPVMPNEAYDTVTGTSSKTMQTVTYSRIIPTHLSYYAKLFDQWSGDIIYRISFASSQFHTGRIQIAYEPGVSVLYEDGTTTPSVLKGSAGPNMVFDLRENKEIIIRIPYNSTTSTKKTIPQYYVQNPGSLATPNPFYNESYSMGRLRIIAVTPLILTDTVADNVMFNVWVAGGENFAYDFPIIRRETLNFTDFNNIYGTVSTSEDRSITQESDIDAGTRNDAISAPGLLKGPTGLTMDDRFKERVLDVRDYAKRYGFTSLSLPLNVSPAPAYMKIAKFYWQVVPLVNYTTVESSFNSFQFPVTAASQNFIWWSGSMRLKFIPITSRTDPLLIAGSFAPFNFRDYENIDRTALAQTGQPVHIQNLSQDCGAEFEIPFVSQYNQLLVNLDVQDAALSAELYAPGSTEISFLTDSTSSRTVINSIVAISAGNDYALRLNIMPPYIYIVHSATGP